MATLHDVATSDLPSGENAADSITCPSRLGIVIRSASATRSMRRISEVNYQ